ncbi:hypothetical protein M9H77_22920 [Catharanthus roseus]|uniref:Uncharacterized protein n=1 Tax=Catharanthus roseus TaxID=4058 RepID=A0ACC0ARG1_CATRO|nr:hypothetical protein M9H77_22920 [Catharanthus roseus]
MQTAEGVRNSRARSYSGRISVKWWPKAAVIVVGDRGTPPGRSTRGGWGGRSHPSSNSGTARQQQQLTQGGRSADAWANTATTDQRRGTTIVVGVETPCCRAESSSNNIPNLSSEQWSKLLTIINNTDVTQSDKLSSMKSLWILDSGCFHHITGKKDSFSNLNNVYPYTIGLSNATKLRANSLARCSPIRQREEEPATKTALLQAVDSPGLAFRAAHHDRPTKHSPAASIPVDSEAQRAQPSTHGPADSLPADSAAHASIPAAQLLFLFCPVKNAPRAQLRIHPIQQASWTRTFSLYLIQWLQIQQH